MKAGAVALAAVLGLGCEHGFTVTGTIEIPVDVQKAFSADRPGRIITLTFAPITMGTLCEPTDKPIVLPFFFDRMGCAEEKELTVFVEPVPAAPYKPVVCGVGQAPHIVTRDDTPMEDRAVAVGRQVVFKGYRGCAWDTAKDEVHLVLKLKEAGVPVP